MHKYIIVNRLISFYNLSMHLLRLTKKPISLQIPILNEKGNFNVFLQKLRLKYINHIRYKKIYGLIKATEDCHSN